MKLDHNTVRREQDRILDVCVDKLMAELVDASGRVKVSRLDPRRGWVRMPADRIIHDRARR